MVDVVVVADSVVVVATVVEVVVVASVVDVVDEVVVVASVEVVVASGSVVVVESGSDVVVVDASGSVVVVVVVSTLWVVVVRTTATVVATGGEEAAVTGMGAVDVVVDEATARVDLVSFTFEPSSVGASSPRLPGADGPVDNLVDIAFGWPRRYGGHEYPDYQNDRSSRAQNSPTYRWRRAVGENSTALRDRAVLPAHRCRDGDRRLALERSCNGLRSFEDGPQRGRHLRRAAPHRRIS